MAELISYSFWLVLLFTCLPLACSSAAGLLVSTAQAVTQISEQGISFLARFLAISALMAIAAERLGGELVTYLQYVLSLIGFMDAI